MTLAVKCLEDFPNLKRVVVVKRPVRYDSLVNRQLSEYGNDLLDELWSKMGAPNKIVIGEQHLECEDDLRTQRFGSPFYQNYDGIHLRGKLASQHMTMTYISMLTGIFPHLKRPVELVKEQETLLLSLIHI